MAGRPRGVDLVHGHSAHVFQGVEGRDGVPIRLGAGDFVDDYAVDRERRNDRGILVEFRADPGGAFEELRLLPTEIYDDSVHVEADEAARWSPEGLQERSEPCGTEFDREGAELGVDV